MITILHEQRTTRTAGASVDGERLWLAADEVERVTGWAWKPEGLCRGEVCMPLPRSGGSPLVDGDRLDVAGAWRRLGHPVVHDDDASTWVLGVGADDRAASLASLQAADFTLPDLAGRSHRLGDHRGSKVLLATWASW